MALALRSKTGCLKCRQRRIKCDEVHPVCQRCRKRGLECFWPGRAHFDLRYLESNTILGNLHASLFLQSEALNFASRPVVGHVLPCPTRSVSPGYPPLRNAAEHQSLVKLATYLSMLTFNRRSHGEVSSGFEFAVALQEVWVRDALLAFAVLVSGEKDKNAIWTKVSPYYSSATKSVRHYLAHDLDESRMEQLLVASQFLGMVDINNPDNEVFPLLHFEATGRLLESLGKIQRDRVLPPAVRHCHRIILESCIYHVSIQSLFWPQTERFATLSTIHECEDSPIDVRPEANVLVKQDLTIYLVLYKLTRLARLKVLTSEAALQARQLSAKIQLIERNASSPEPQRTTSGPGPSRADFHQWTKLAASALAIFSAKILDRSLLSTSPSMRPLVETTLNRLDHCKPARAWTGDYVWLFAILSCAVSTKDECERLSRSIQVFSTGFWGPDLVRMNKVLGLVRSKRVAIVKSLFDSDADVAANDTLNLLVEARLSLL